MVFTEVWGTRAPGGPNGRAPALVVPAMPSLFVRVYDRPPRAMPEFFTKDNRPIRVAKIVTAKDDRWSVRRVDLDIKSGVIVVRFPGIHTPTATYTIDPAFTPRTRSVELLPTGMTLWVDSDAVAFRIDGQPFSSLHFNDGRVHVETDRRQRIVALYSNGTEEVIYDDVPRDRSAVPTPEAIQREETERRAEAKQHAEDSRRIQWFMLGAALLLSLAAMGRIVLRRAADSDGP